MNSVGKSALIAYVPAPHRGYLTLFRKYQDRTLYILGNEFVSEFQSLVRNLPAPDPKEVCTMVQALGILREVRLLEPTMLDNLAGLSIVMPDEDVSRAFAQTHLAGADVTFDGSWRLRFDWGAVTANKTPDGDVISHAKLDQELMREATNQATRSPDWWRQVGAVLARAGLPLITAYNTHFPSEQSSYLEGDPRSNFGPGERIEVSAALHAEIAVLTEAARRGIATEGCDLYVTTFPCPPCAYAVANSGVKRLFYETGYSLLAGAEALTSRGVALIRVAP